ncbi:MAG TPA: class I tRNA ligase family protein, partial [Actinomycetota bacterium]|nr:class I tRNA ligase family protein [Actinomycetota bacterium]
MGHEGTSDDPHDEQKRAPSGFSTPHAAQVFTAASLRPGADAEPVGARVAERPEAMRASLRLPRMNVPEKPSIEGLEAKWDEWWEAAGTYRFDRTKPREDVFAIDTPPPTASGSLHIGHV